VTPAGVVIALLALASASRAQDAQAPKDPAPGAGEVRVEVRGAPLKSVLRALAAQSGITLVLPDDIDATVTGSFHAASTEALIELLGRAQGYRLERAGNQLSLTRAPAVEPKRETAPVGTSSPVTTPATTPTQDASERQSRLFVLRRFPVDRIGGELTKRFGKVVSTVPLLGRDVLVLAPAPLLERIAQHVASLERPEVEERVFTIQHASVDAVANEVSVLLTPNVGSMGARSRKDTLLVRDDKLALERIANRIKALDRAPATVKLDGAVLELPLSAPLALGRASFTSTNDLPPDFPDVTGPGLLERQTVSEESLDRIVAALTKGKSAVLVAHGHASGAERKAVALRFDKEGEEESPVPLFSVRVTPRVTGPYVSLSVEFGEGLAPGLAPALVRVKSGRTLVLRGFWKAVRKSPHELPEETCELVILVRPTVELPATIPPPVRDDARAPAPQGEVPDFAMPESWSPAR
jgi:hypothetical protein